MLPFLGVIKAKPDWQELVMSVGHLKAVTNGDGTAKSLSEARKTTGQKTFTSVWQWGPRLCRLVCRLGGMILGNVVALVRTEAAEKFACPPAGRALIWKDMCYYQQRWFP